MVVGLKERFENTISRSRDWRRRIVREVALSVASLCFVTLVGIAVAGGANVFMSMIVASAALSSAFMRALFPERPFFALTFANLIAVYITIFAFFIEEVFHGVPQEVAAAGFVMPILLFLFGCWLGRAEIKRVIEAPGLQDGEALFSAMAWLIPIFMVGALVLALSVSAAGTLNSVTAFLSAMGLIGLIVLAVSRNVALFLVDVGLLFEEFFHRMSRLAIPAFAFLTFYSLLVIVFASLYAILSQLSPEPHFRIGSTVRAVSFSEAIHFSIVTISTVGYGDIVPASNLARVLSSLEVVCGVLLLLFGVSELLEYTREHRQSRHHLPPPAQRAEPSRESANPTTSQRGEVRS